MAAPSIPNLNTLKGRGGLRGLRGRATRGRREAVDGESEEDKANARDLIIQQTDNDASSSRMSAVALGYLNDDYARAFIHGQIPKRYPIINRGTYVRSTAIDKLVLSFLIQNPESAKQIISLGAGSDTRFFRLGDTSNLIYHEIDFASNTAQKINAIERTPSLQSRTGPFSTNDTRTSLSGQNYHIHPLDLRDLATPFPTVSIPSINPSLPTLVLSECCLCYLPHTTTTSILQTLLFQILHPTTPAGLILYEPIRPHDPFGQTMISNLGSRGIHLQTLKRYHSLAAQRLRIKNAGFVDGQGARDVESIYYGSGDQGEEWIPETQRQRVESLQWLDEVEEWRLLARHYCVAWGWRDCGRSERSFGKAWGGVRGERTEGERGDDEVG